MRDALWLSMALEPPDRPRLLRLRLLGSHAPPERPAACSGGGASVDLAYRDGRAMLERVAARRLMWVVYMEAGRGEVVAAEHIHLDEAAAFLRGAVARAAEWHPEPLSPPELTVAAWRAAAGRAPCLAPATEGATAVLVVPAGVLAGLEHGGGAVVVRAPDDDAPWDRLELVVAWGGAPRAVELDMRRRCQRDLAWRLARQRELVVLAAGARPGDPASARLTATLGPLSRPSSTGRVAGAEALAGGQEAVEAVISRAAHRSASGIVR